METVSKEIMPILVRGAIKPKYGTQPYDVMIGYDGRSFFFKQVNNDICGNYKIKMSREEAMNVADFIKGKDKHKILNCNGTRWITREENGSIVYWFQEHPNPDAITTFPFSPEAAEKMCLYFSVYKDVA